MLFCLLLSLDTKSDIVETPVSRLLQIFAAHRVHDVWLCRLGAPLTKDLSVILEHCTLLEICYTKHYVSYAIFNVMLGLQINHEYTLCYSAQRKHWFLSKLRLLILRTVYFWIRFDENAILKDVFNLLTCNQVIIKISFLKEVTYYKCIIYCCCWIFNVTH